MKLLQSQAGLTTGPFALDDNFVFLVSFFYRHVQTVTLVTIQPISKVVLTTEKERLCRCRQVRTDPKFL